MTRTELLEQLKELPEETFEQLAPLIQADIEAITHLDEIQREIEAGRQSAQDGPLVSAEDAFEAAEAALKT